MVGVEEYLVEVVDAEDELVGEALGDGRVEDGGPVVDVMGPASKK